MLLERLYDDDLAQAAYLLGCPATGTAIVVDPSRDFQRYVDAAAKARLRIAFVTETHIHADFVSGADALARATGAQLLLSGEGGEDWSYRYAPDARLLRDRDTIDVGRIRLEVRHTPGHTPEHVVFIVTDTESSAKPMGVLTGDFIFVGDVGRPDLLERAANVAGTMDGLARSLFRSLRSFADLPDYLQLWPGHGAGSSCGKALGAVPSTTLGFERIANWAFAIDTEDAFVREALAGQSQPPKYFARMKQLNRDGAPGWIDAPMPRIPGDAALAGADDATLVDIRKTALFMAEHVRGSFNVPVGTSLAKWAGSFFRHDQPIVLVDNADSPNAVERARHALKVIGFDSVVGWAGSDLFAAARAAGRIERTPQQSVGEAHEAASAGAAQILDVRDAHEWEHEHIPGALHVRLGDLPAAAAELDPTRPVVLHCESGSRSAIGTSVLLAKGFTSVSNMSGGIVAWEKAGYPIDHG